MLGEPVKRATTESLLIVGVTALAGALAAARAGRVRFRVALTFAAAGAVAAVGGTALNLLVGGRVILLGFGALLIVAAYAMATERRAGTAAPVDQSVPDWARVPAAGAAAGLLTGFFGVGGGFVIVPALTLLVGLPMTLAVGTSLLVIALTSAVAFTAHLTTGSINTSLSAAFTVAAIVGAMTGSRLHGRFPEPRLRKLFAMLLVAAAAFVIAKTVGG